MDHSPVLSSYLNSVKSSEMLRPEQIVFWVDLTHGHLPYNGTVLTKLLTDGTVWSVNTDTTDR